MRPGVWDGSYDILATMASRPLIEDLMTERLLQSLEKISKITDPSKMWIASPNTSDQVAPTSKARRMIIMGSTVDEAIAAVSSSGGDNNQNAQPQALPKSARGNRPVEPVPPKVMGPPPVPAHRKGQGKAPIVVAEPATTVVTPPWRLPIAKAQAAPRPEQDIVEVLDVDSEDS
eukprot:5457268-Amphidinium_carterae.1